MRQFRNTVGAIAPLCSLLLSLSLAGCGVPSALHPTSSTASFSTMADKASLPGFMQETFKQSDADHDGVLSPQELDLSPDQFKLLDRNGDGKVDADEWQAQVPLSDLQKMWPVFKPLLDALFKYMDSNHDGMLTALELHQAFSTPSKYTFLSENSLNAAFQAADLNRDGMLDRSEFNGFYRAVSGVFNGPQDANIDVVQALLGTYLGLTSHIAADIALHPPHRGPDTSVTPATLGIAYEEITLQTADNLTLRGWYIPAAVPTTKGVVMVHGITSNRRCFVENGEIAMLHPEFNLVLFDLRNHGQSDGKVTTFGYYEGQDGLAAIEYLKSRGNTQVAIAGDSLGGATTIRTAALSPDIKGVVDDCSYATVQRAFEGFTAVTRLPAPDLIAGATVAYANQQLNIDMTTTQPLSQVPRIAPRPFLVIHGAADPFVSPDNSRMNYEAAGDGFYKQLWIVPGAGHDGSSEKDPVGYKAHLLDLLHHAFN